MSARPVSCRCRCGAVETTQSLQFMRNEEDYLLTFGGRPYMSIFVLSLGTEPVIALCNSKVSCFSTRIFRYRLEQHGLKLSGFVRVKEPVNHNPSS